MAVDTILDASAGAIVLAQEAQRRHGVTQENLSLEKHKSTGRRTSKIKFRHPETGQKVRSELKVIHIYNDEEAQGLAQYELLQLDKARTLIAVIHGTIDGEEVYIPYYE